MQNYFHLETCQIRDQIFTCLNNDKAKLNKDLYNNSIYFPKMFIQDR